jgi:hypothetical protein
VLVVGQAALQLRSDRQAALFWHVEELGQQHVLRQLPHAVPFDVHVVPPLEVPVVVAPDELVVMPDELVVTPDELVVPLVPVVVPLPV